MFASTLLTLSLTASGGALAPSASTLAPVELGSAATIGLARRVVVQGDYAYVVSANHGLEIFDISPPSAVLPVGDVATPGDAYDVAVDGAACYVADNAGGLQVIDVSDPQDPQIAMTIPTGFFTNSVFGVLTAPDLLFVFAGPGGLYVFDTSLDPLAPTLLGDSGNSVVYHNDGVLVGDDLIVADGVHGPTVFDVSDPSDPQPAGSAAVGSAFDLALVGRNIQVVSNDSFYRTYDGTALGTPGEILASTPVPSLSLDIDAWPAAPGGPLVFVADVFGGVLVYDVTDELVHDHVDTFASDTGAWGITLHRGAAFVCAGGGGLRIFGL